MSVLKLWMKTFGITCLMLGAAASITCLGLIIQIGVDAEPEMSNDPMMSMPVQERREMTADEVLADLREFDLEQVKAFDSVARELDTFFLDNRQKCRKMAERLLSLEGKWEAIKEAVTDDRKAYERYVQQTFEETFFAGRELEDRVGEIARQYLSLVAGNESQMLVELRQDVALKSLYLDSFATQPEFEKAFQQILMRTMERVRNALINDVPQFLVSNLVSDLVAAVLVRTVASSAISGGILASGAATGVATLGVGFVLGIVIDQIMAIILKEFGYDPEKELADELDKTLQQMHSRIMYGDPEKTKIYNQIHSRMNGCNNPGERDELCKQTWAMSLSGELGLRHTLTSLYMQYALARNECLQTMILDQAK